MRRVSHICPFLGVALSTACHASLPQPATAPQPENAFIEVPYPPPPARVEIVVPRPAASQVVWLDGQWTWDGANWSWEDGGWALPPKGGRYAIWALRLERDGRLEFAPASWRDDAGKELSPAQVLAPAKRH
jgi:hypothetical protein